MTVAERDAYRAIEVYGSAERALKVMLSISDPALPKEHKAVMRWLARLAGTPLPSPSAPTLDPEKIAQIRRLRAKNYSIRYIAEVVCCTRATVRKYGTRSK